MIKLSKRVISCLLVFVLCMGVVQVRAENTETVTDNGTEAVGGMMTVSSEIQEMMSVLKLFEIIPEYYDYNVPVASEVTRADFAAAVARLMGKNIYGGNNVYFYDVPKTHWAYNEISNLVELGIINGSGNKMFNPDVAITKAEAYKILLTVMGYGMYAESKGGFPKGYIEIASKIEITKGVSNNDKIIMSDMFRLLYNVMKTDIMEPVVVGESVIYEDAEGESLLSKYRDVYYAEGFVNGANTVTVDNGSLKKGDVLIDDEIYKSGNVSMFDYIGQEVEFFYHEDESEDKTILWAVAMNDDDILNINVDSDASFDEKNFVYTYYDGNERERTIKLDRGITLVYNGGVIESGYDEILNRNRYSLKLVKNDGKYTIAIVKEYKNYVAGSISASEFKIYDKIVPQESIVLDEELYDTFSMKMSGLTDMAFEDIKQGSVLSVFESEDKKHIEVVVNNNMIVGTINRIEENAHYYDVLVNESEYRMDKSVYDGSVSLGDSVNAYLDVSGDIAYIESTETKFQGAFIISVYHQEEADDEVGIKYLAEDGNITVSKCAKKVIIDGKRFKTVAEIKGALIAGEREFISQFALVKKNSDSEIIEIDTVTHNPKYENASSLAIDVPFKNEEETEMKQKHVRATAAATRIGEKIIFDANSIIFSIPMTDNYKEASKEEFAVLPATGMINETGVYAQSYKTAEESGISKYILVQGYDAKSATFESPIIVDNIGTGVDDEGCDVEILNGYQGATPVSVYASASESDIFSKSGAVPGALVKISRNNSGNVDECIVLYDYHKTDDENKVTKEVKNLNAVVGVFSGYVNNVVDDVLKIGFYSGDEYDYAIKVGSIPVLIYDTTAKKKPIYAGNIGDAVTNKNNPGECSEVVVITTRMQGRMILIYK